MNAKKHVAVFSGAVFLLWGVRAVADCNLQPWTFAGSTVTKEKIATTGRVLSRSPVRTGARVASTRTGIRMHRPGTLLGKALEPLDGGEGEILVLLSLQ